MIFWEKILQFRAQIITLRCQKERSSPWGQAQDFSDLPHIAWVCFSDFNGIYIMGFNLRLYGIYLHLMGFNHQQWGLWRYTY